MGTSIVVTSGKGGTGKSSFTVGVASCLAAMGKEVLCIDMDFGLRNLDLSLGVADAALMDVTDVLQGRCPLERAVVRQPRLEHLSLLPAPATRPPAPLDRDAMKTLMKQVRQSYDFCFLDCPAGIGSGFTLAVSGADQAVVVANPDPITIRAAQAAVYQLRDEKIPARLAVNRITRRILRRLDTNIDDAMDTLGLPLIGIIPEDPYVTLAASQGSPLILSRSRGAARAYYNIAKRLLGQRVPPMRIR